jgi:hypothetical protein
MKAIRYTLVITVLLVLGVLAARFLLESEPGEPAPKEVAAAPAKDSRPAPAPAAPAQTAAVEAQYHLEPVNVPGSEGEHGEFTTNTDVLKQKIFKTEPKLAQFDFFREHVLLDANSRADYRQLLADKAMYTQVRQALLQPADVEDTMESNVKRLLQIDYLREALHWRENPEREHLLSTVEAIILEDSFRDTMPAEVKRSVAASKMELFELLHGHEPERAQALVAAAKGTRLEKLLEYIDGYNQRRLELERKLSLQAMKQSDTP